MSVMSTEVYNFKLATLSEPTDACQKQSRDIVIFRRSCINSFF